ncbi:putative sodium: solute symporter [Candidatus Ichthyocystis hellenicum]|uniref:Putative sodium: solute symporter n=2 Tax=Candidatus Ichthyocystis TaxID=2929841 RepID=A0A0S4M3N7_9BURK|nr:putative sodium: solute symporter [Candidatus Ichthyocystis hellenicum]
MLTQYKKSTQQNHQFLITNERLEKRIIPKKCANHHIKNLSTPSCHSIQLVFNIIPTILTQTKKPSCQKKKFVELLRVYLGECVFPMLITLIAIFISFILALGYVSSRRVRTSQDFISANRSLNTYLLTPIIVCSWIGGGSLLGAPAIFLEKGISGVIGDPFGTTLCMWLVAFFLGKTIYRKKVTTLGEYFRNRFGPQIEQLLSLAIVLSYLGWSVSVLHATQIILQLLTNQWLTHKSASALAGVAIILYTIFGGMWSAAATNYLITIVVFSGLFTVFHSVSHPIGGVIPLISIAIDQGQFKLFPDTSLKALLTQFSALAIMTLGLIPQQDLLQRINSARNEKTIFLSHIFGGILYFVISMVPILTAYAIKISHPDIADYWIKKDPQFILPMYILNYSSLLVKVCFFGALFSSLLTSGSTSILAPSVSIVENIILPFKKLKDKQVLFLSRVLIVAFVFTVTVVNIVSTKSIYQQILNAYSITLVVVLVPMISGLYWEKANMMGVIISIIVGVTSWIASWYVPSILPGVLIGLIGSAAGMVVGSMLCRKSSLYNA